MRLFFNPGFFAILALTFFAVLPASLAQSPKDPQKDPVITAKNVNYPLHLDAQIGNTIIPFNATFSLEKTIHKTVMVNQTVTVPECLDVPVDPNAGDWKGYWDVTATDRAQRLSFAIQGLSVADAEKVIHEGFFRYRPHFWSEFTREIRNAEAVLRQMGVPAQFNDAVTITNGEANARALGFWTDANCRMNTIVRSVPTDVTEQVPAGTYVRHYLIRVQGTLFQSFESDDFSISLGLDHHDVTLTDADDLFHAYHVQPVLNPDASVTVMLIAKRKLVSIPYSGIDAALTRTGTGFTAEFKVDPKYLPSSNDPDSKLMVDYNSCHSVFLGCKTVESGTMEMTSAEMQTLLKGAYTSGESYRLRFRFYRTHSRFYSNVGTSAQTERVRY